MTRIFAAKPLDYHLAHNGGLESVFTPTYKMILDHRQLLFAGGDARVASLLLWHFCEEIEHRSSGVAVYDAVVGKYFYRVGNFRNFMAHVKKVTDMLRAEFIKHVPGVTAEMFKGSPNSALPRMAKLKAAMCMLAAQMPWHNSDRQALPAYYHEWTDRFDRGEDMRQVYGARWEEAELAAAE